MTKNKIPPGTSGDVEVELPDIYIKPGEYPLYFELTDSQFNSYAKDVLDDLTAPIVIKGGTKILKNTDFHPDFPSGFFAMQSRILANEIDTHKINKVVL